MNKQPLLPVRSKPYESESFKGYVLRLAYRNGRKKLSDLIRTTNTVSGKNKFIVGHPNWHRFTSNLSPFLGLEEMQLQQYFGMENCFSVLDKDRMVNDIRNQRSTICPCCMAEKGYLQPEWEYIYNTHCKQHKVQLLDQCSFCQGCFEWQPELIQGCPHCEQPWKAFKPPYSPIPKYQVLAEDFKSTNDKYSEHALVSAFVISLRPFDFMYGTLSQTALSNAECHYHFLQAYQLLTDQMYAAHWMAEYERFGFRTPHIKNLPVYAFLREAQLNVPMQWRFETVHEVSQKKITRELVLTKFRVNNLKRVSAEFQLGLLEAAAYFNLNELEYDQLLDLKIVSPVNSPHCLSHVVFDLEHLLQVNQSIESKATLIPEHDRKSLVGIDAIFNKLKYFGMGKAALLRALLDHKAPVYKVDETRFWYELSVNEKDFLGWLQSVYLDYLPSVMPLPEFCSMLKLNKDQARELVRSTDLHFTGWRSNDWIDADIVRKFFRQHQVLGRFTALTGRCCQKAYQDLSSKGVHPLFNPTEGFENAVYTIDQLPFSIAA